MPPRSGRKLHFLPSTELKEEEGYETDTMTDSLEKIINTHPSSDVQTIPEGHTNATTEAVGSSSGRCSSLRHTSESEEHVKTEEILQIKEEEYDESQPMTMITNEAWQTANAMCEMYPELVNENEINTNSLSETISMYSGSDSQYTKWIGPEQTFNERRDEFIPEIKKEITRGRRDVDRHQA